MANLVPLTAVGFPDLVNLDTNASIDEIIERIRANDDWNSIFDGELFQNSTTAELYFFTYLWNKFGETTNRLVRENFLADAISDRSVVSLLFQQGIEIQQNRSSAVTVLGTVQETFLQNDLFIPAGTQLVGLDTEGNETIFEFYNLDSNNKIDYDAPVVITANAATRKTFSTTVYSGETFIDTIELASDDKENFFIDIDRADIIENSIRVFYEKGGFFETELISTDTFIISPNPTNPIAFPDGTPHYNVRQNEDGSARIYLGSEAFGGAFPDPEGRSITIYGRTGGGTKDNINIGGITTSISLSADPETISVAFTNLSSGSGGGDREDLDTVRAFGPSRANVGNAIVRDIDALNVLRPQVSKHTVYSPLPSPVSNLIYANHSFHYVAPLQNMSDFVFPSVDPTDNAVTYQIKFETAFRNFLTPDGIHDQLITDELVNLFYVDGTNHNFSSELGNTFPLNGTLFVSAFDIDGNEIDRVSFTGNYSGSTNVADPSTDQAEVISTIAEITGATPITISPTGSNQLSVRWDTTSLAVTITIPSGTYSTPSDLATQMTAQFQSELNTTHPAYFATFSNHDWVQVEGATIKLVSPSVDTNSQIEIFALPSAADDARGVIGFTATGLTRAEPRSGTVFLANTNYNHDTFTVDYVINTANQSQDQTTDDATQWEQDPAIQTGPILSFTLNEIERPTSLVQLQAGSQLLVEAYQDAAQTVLLDRVIYDNIEEGVSTTGGIDTSLPSNPVFANSLAHIYDYATATLNAQFVDGVLTPVEATPIVSDDLAGQTSYTVSTPDTVLVPDATQVSITNTLISVVEDNSIQLSVGGSPVLANDDGLGGFTSTSLSITGETVGTGDNVNLNPVNTVLAKAQLDTSVDVVLNWQRPLASPRSATLTFNATGILQSVTGPDASEIDTANFTVATNTLSVTWLVAPDAFIITADYNYKPVNESTSTINYTTGDVNIDLYQGEGLLAQDYQLDYTFKGVDGSTITFTIDSSVYNFPVTQGSLFTVLDEALSEGFDFNGGSPDLPSRTGGAATFNPGSYAEAWTYAANHEILGLADPTPVLNSVDDGTNILTIFEVNLVPQDQVQFNSLITGTASNITVNNVPKLFAVAPPTSTGTEQVPYVAGFTIDNIKVSYVRKNYEFITASYQPDPYNPEGEASTLLGELRATDRAMAIHEHLLRQVDYQFVPIQATITVSKAKSPATVRTNTRSLIYQYFSYDNDLTENQIGGGFNANKLFSVINDSVNLNKGVITTDITTPATNIQDSSSIGDQYYFVVPLDIVDRLKTLEEEFPIIDGVSENYDVVIQTVQQT